MRYIELLSEQQLDEVRMSPKAFRKFLNSPEAEGMMAGFEAEMWFASVLDPGGEAEESDPDYEEDTTVDSIRQVLRFFDDSSSPSQLRRAEDRMRDDYQEWADRMIRDKWDFDEEDHIEEFLISEGDYDKESSMVEYLMDELSINEGEAEEILEFGKHGSMSIKMRESDPTKWDAYLDSLEYAQEKLKNMVEDIISSKDRRYDRAFDHYIEDEEYPDESEWFESENLTYMSEVGDRYHLEWPYYTNRYDEGDEPGEYDYNTAVNIGDLLKNELGVKVQVMRHTRGAQDKKDRPDDTWIIEPDGSLDDEREPQDMPLEISSPAMPLKQCYEMMEKFYKWAQHNNAYANYECSCHIGVSLPQPVGGKVDILKLALFLGDRRVLEEFDRMSNHYCESAMDKIEQKLSTGSMKVENITSAIDHMRSGLVELASIALNRIPQFELGADSEGDKNIKHGMGKYTSINPHYENPNKTYIEFRSAGGEDYFESPNDIKKLQDTLMRYSKAMQIASDPNSERKEYSRKMYNLLQPSIEKHDELGLFVKYAAGEMTVDELKKRWANFATMKQDPKKQGLAQQIFAKQNQQPVSPSDSTQHNSAGDMGIYNANIGPNTIRNATPYFRFNYNSVPPDQIQNVLMAWADRMNLRYSDYVIAKVPPEIGQTIEAVPNVRVQARTGQPQSAFTPPQPTDQTTGWWRIVDADGNELHRFRGMGNYQSNANQMASQWARENGITGPIEVYPIST